MSRHRLVSVFLIVLISLFGDNVFADISTGFEVSDGFTVGGAWPAGWSSSGSGFSGITTTTPAVGNQSLQVHQGSQTAIVTYGNASAIPATENYQLDLLLRPSDYAAPNEYNFAGYGHMIAFRQDFSFAGGLLFRINDIDGNDPAQADDYQIVFWNTSSSAAEVVGAFSPGAWYDYSMIINPNAGTVTHRVSPFGGGFTIERTYSNSVTSMPMVSFYGDNNPGGSSAQFDEFSMATAQVIPEPSNLTLLGLAVCGLILRRCRCRG